MILRSLSVRHRLLFRDNGLNQARSDRAPAACAKLASSDRWRWRRAAAAKAAAPSVRRRTKRLKRAKCSEIHAWRLEPGMCYIITGSTHVCVCFRSATITRSEYANFRNQLKIQLYQRLFYINLKIFYRIIRQRKRTQINFLLLQERVTKNGKEDTNQQVDGGWMGFYRLHIDGATYDSHQLSNTSIFRAVFSTKRAKSAMAYVSVWRAQTCRHASEIRIIIFPKSVTNSRRIPKPKTEPR